MGKNAARDDTEQKMIKVNYYVEGNSVRRLDGEPEERRQRQLEEEKERSRQKNRRTARRNQEKAARMSLGYVLFCTAVLTAICGALVFCIRIRSDISVRAKRISKLEQNIESLRTENDAAIRQMELMIDINKVKEKALEYGMQYADEGQIFYYNIEADDYMDQYSDIPKK